MTVPSASTSQPESLFVSTTPGLEPALERELRRLRLRTKRVVGGVEVDGPKGLHRTLNLQLRCASRVLLRIATFSAPDASALQKGLQGLGGIKPVAVTTTSNRSRVAAGLARDVAARVLRIKLPSRDADEDEPVGLAMQLRLENDQCTVSIDTSGPLLYRRGYRQEVSRAPLRETLAAGVLELADFRGDEPLWDPMCGSGTFVIEGALAAMDRAPGLVVDDRRFAFESFPDFDAAAATAFAQEKAALRAREKPKPPFEIRATDLNAGSLGVARRNARRAGVQPFLTLERDDVFAPKHLPQAPHGLLVANPPYGKRVGEGDDVTPLYAALGALLRERLPGWRGAILVPELRLEHAIGLEPEDVFDVDNGGIALRLLLFAPARRVQPA